MEHCLVYQDISISQIEDSHIAALTGLKKAIQYLEGGVGLSCSRSHHKHHPLLSSRKGIHNSINNNSLVVAWFSTISVIVVGLLNNLQLFAGVVLVSAESFPKSFLGRESIHLIALLLCCRKAVELKGLTIAAERKGSVQECRILDSLLDTCSFQLTFPLCFYHSKGFAIGCKQEIVCKQSLFTIRLIVLIYMDTAIRDFILIPHILMKLPSGFLQRLGNDFSGFGLIDLTSIHAHDEHITIRDCINYQR